MLEPAKYIAKTRLRSTLFSVVETLGNRVGYRPRHHSYDCIVGAFYLKELYDQIEHLPGDVAECGVAYGNSLVVLCALAQQEAKGRVVYGFDSFEGFPEPTIEDTSTRQPRKGDFSDATEARVIKTIREAGITQPVLIKGFFHDTLPTFQGSLALLHIDGDLYASYKTVLNELFAKVVPGGIVAFDEYREDKWPGATKAIDEFISGRYRMRKAKYLNKYYIVKA